MGISKYSDINQYEPTEDPKVYELESIYQSIDNIIYTQKKQRLFLPEFGTDLMQYLFEPMTKLTVFSIKNEIIQAVSKWEPRVRLIRQLSNVKESEDFHSVDVFLVFEVVGIQGGEQYVYQTTLNQNKLGQYYAI